MMQIRGQYFRHFAFKIETSKLSKVLFRVCRNTVSVYKKKQVCSPVEI
jgi:hypothetical protein